MTGRIFDIKRFAVHDGDGIRTTVFFKGCPLRCVWCHNPEGLGTKTEIARFAHKCIGCGGCKSENFTPADCLGEAYAQYGRDITPDELIPLLLEDRAFYQSTGGGVTLSGGECLMQADFARELLSRLKKQGIHTAIDTSGFAPRRELDKVIPYTDLFLYDLKAYSEECHLRYTGRSNAQILDNLYYLDSLGKRIEIRVPFVPECNSQEMEGIASVIARLGHVSTVRLLPYHSYAASKYEALGMKNTLPVRIPTEYELSEARELIHSITGLRVI